MLLASLTKRTPACVCSSALPDHVLLLLLQPKAYAYFELITPEVYSSPRAIAALKLFQMSVDDALSEYRQVH
eukprot:18727-Heterococcus_DN1.PRE.2